VVGVVIGVLVLVDEFEGLLATGVEVEVEIEDITVFDEDDVVIKDDDDCG